MGLTLQQGDEGRQGSQESTIREKQSWPGTTLLWEGCCGSLNDTRLWGDAPGQMGSQGQCGGQGQPGREEWDMGGKCQHFKQRSEVMATGYSGLVGVGREEPKEGRA